MKIAILTLPLHGNYGGIIQNYALQTILKQMGHEAVTLNVQNTPFGRKHDMPLLKWLFSFRKSRAKRHVRRFINENIRLTASLYTKKDLCRFDLSGYDAVIVGSDQVWRACYAYPDIYAYYLDFVSNPHVKKIAFSASFGSDSPEYTPEQTAVCGEYIRDFDLITVREHGALHLIKDVYKWQCKYVPVQTLDPTMLLPKAEYMKLLSVCDDQKCPGELFYYVLDMTEEKRGIINKIARDLGVNPFTVNRKTRKWLAKPHDREVPPLEEWLMAFHKARYVFTDSFHGSVFSIVFNKEFIALGNPKRGMGRFHSLMDTFRLQDRLVFKSEECTSALLATPVDWHSVNSILETEKGISLGYLNRCLSSSPDR
ncbi:MAG: polysaccharide pyruvyl transferase family protein [Bacteroides sp.]|nr:polysaccharide pyruvyl transferase family protein [Bacteroides sp.]MCM1448370.1 polysaccharide pyruvyl transferase family protein [Bacteroides sp.]MCM1516029.1 polysaccharide pyruvyl transferase family protein [Paraprevotella sp.]